MTAAVNLNRLMMRRHEIAAQQEALTKEAAEIDLVLEVIERYSDDPPADAGPAARRTGAPRPKGIPTLWEMTVKAISLQGGPDGLSPAEVANYIRDHYWPGLDRAQIVPSLYRFRQEGRLTKEGSKFKLLERKKAGADTADLLGNQ